MWPVFRVLAVASTEFALSGALIERSPARLRKYNHRGGSLKIAAIEDPPVIVKILSHLALPTPPRHVPRLVESIYSERSEEPKPFANALRKLSRLPTGRADRHNSGFFIKQKKELTSLPVVRYGRGHRKGRLKILSIRSRS